MALVRFLRVCTRAVFQSVYVSQWATATVIHTDALNSLQKWFPFLQLLQEKKIKFPAALKGYCCHHSDGIQVDVWSSRISEQPRCRLSTVSPSLQAGYSGFVNLFWCWCLMDSLSLLRWKWSTCMISLHWKVSLNNESNSWPVQCKQTQFPLFSGIFCFLHSGWFRMWMSNRCTW